MTDGCIVQWESDWAMYLYVLTGDWFPESLMAETNGKATREWRRSFGRNDATLLQKVQNSMKNKFTQDTVVQEPVPQRTGALNTQLCHWDLCHI